MQNPFSLFRSLLPVAVLTLCLGAGPAFSQHSVPGCADVTAGEFRKVAFLDKTILPGLNEPIKMTFDKEGRFYWIERTGAVKRWDPATRTAATLVQINVRVDNTRGGMGITLDPAFQSNGFVYVVYFPNIPPYGLFRLSRYTLAGDKLQDEKIVLDVAITVGYGQHASGAMAWDNEGNLFWGLGDNSKPTNYAALSNSVAGEDSRRSSGSSNSLLGKILRIHPEANGTYTIPGGNLFPPGTALTRPEIYAMGFRNPWTLWFDKRKGWLFEGEVGPDGGSADANQGPAAQDEINIVKTPGNYGWPFLGGHNLAYKFEGATFDPENLVNASPFNTGMKNLPPARSALLAWGHDGKSADQARWPVMGGNDGTAMSGPLYRYDPALASKVKLPPHFDGTLLFSDWELSWMLAADVDAEGKAVSEVKKPFGGMAFNNPIAMTIGPEGALYVIEYGNAYFSAPSTQKISRVEYTGSCLPTEWSTGLAMGEGLRSGTAGRSGGRLEARLDEGRLMWRVPGGSGSAIDAQGRH
ncbi:MAG: domain containing protein [Fibrobacteres bacterium]|nr:domain containing protein [Fibrobacterota bacterium]